MRKSVLYISFLILTALGLAQPKVYINLNSHNETNGEPLYDANMPINYITAHTAIKEIADSVISKKVKWNFQSDVRFLFGALKHDPKSANTGNTNIIKWMDDSPYIECDPHSHEGVVNGKTYNYADVAHLHDSLGATNRKNVGGLKIDGLQNGSDWETLENGMPCSYYKSAPNWKPNVLWGGSYSAGTHNDMNTFGCWKPQNKTNYATHVNTNRLRLQGNGCVMVFHDSTDEQRIIREVKKIITNVKNGVYPANNFYTQVIQFNCRDISKANYIPRLCKIMDSVNVYTKKGWAEWMTISEKDAYWVNTLDSAYYRLDCDNLPSSITEANAKQAALNVYPNPSSGNNVTIEADIMIAEITVYDITGKRCATSVVNSNKHELNVASLRKGLYTIRIDFKDGTHSNKKITLE